MRRARFLEQERELAAERRVKYRGTASIKLEALHSRDDDLRELDEKNVARLKRLFQEDGCRRLELRNHVPALIDQQQLDAAIQASGTSAEGLLADPSNGYPELYFPPGYQLGVDLYRTDLNQELKSTLVKEYSNEKKPDDGELYRKIRGYQLQRNVYFEKRWWARLSAISDHRRECLKQLFRHRDFAAAFDALLDIPGLWAGMRISTLHKLIGMRCDEEILCYLDHIKEVWYRVLRGDRQAMQRVDRATVKALELTAPGACRADAQALYGQLRSGRIFGAFDKQDRETIWSEVCSISTDRLIPSFFSFFEDVNYCRGVACASRAARDRRDLLTLCM